MQFVWWFLGVLMATVPLVVALVNAVSDDVPKMPRWGKRLLALGFGVGLAFIAEYVLSLYGLASFPWQITALGGCAVGLNAAGVYDISKLVGGSSAGIQRE